MTKKPTNPHCWRKYLTLQGLLTLFIALIFWGIFNSKIAFAALVGGLISCLANLIFAGWFFSVQGVAQKSKKIVSAFYVAEGLKILFTAALFALVIVYLPVPLLPLFVSYFVIHVSFSFIALTI